MQGILRSYPSALWPGLVFVLLLSTALMLDVRVFLWSQTLTINIIDSFQLITQLGHATWMLALITSVTLLFFQLARRYRNRRHGDTFSRLAQQCVFVLVSVSGAGLFAVCLKYLIGRVRPSQFAEFGAYYLSPLTIHSEFASFPSGHSTNLFALAFSLCVFLPRLRIPLLFLASGIAFSRVIIGEHFLSDFAGGALLSFLFVSWWRHQAVARNYIAEIPLQAM